MARGGSGGRGGIAVRHGSSVAHVRDVQQAAHLMLLLNGELRTGGASGAAGSPASLGGQAQRVLGAAAGLVASVGGGTLAKGLASLRDGGRRPASHMARSWRELDAASALIRHPGEAEAIVSGAVAWLGASAQASPPSTRSDLASPVDEYVESVEEFWIGSDEDELHAGEQFPATPFFPLLANGETASRQLDHGGGEQALPTEVRVMEQGGTIVRRRWAEDLCGDTLLAVDVEGTADADYLDTVVDDQVQQDIVQAPEAPTCAGVVPLLSEANVDVKYEQEDVSVGCHGPSAIVGYGLGKDESDEYDAQLHAQQVFAKDPEVAALVDPSEQKADTSVDGLREVPSFTLRKTGLVAEDMVDGAGILEAAANFLKVMDVAGYTAEAKRSALVEAVGLELASAYLG